jgi:hypothetical protein
LKTKNITAASWAEKRRVKMKVALIGATGFVGSHLLKEFLDRGEQVTAIARNTEQLAGIENPNLKVVKADVLNENEVADAVAGSDVVVSAYNAGWANPNLYNEFLEGAQAIQAGVKKAGVKRLIVIGGAGSLLALDGTQLVDSPQFPEDIKPGAAAARDYLNTIKNENDLDWTFFSPPPEMHQGITTGRTAKYRLGKDNPVADETGRSYLSVEDLSVAIADEVENPRHIKQRFTAAY